MSTYQQTLFHVEEMVIPAMHPRCTPLSTANFRARLNLSCKMYKPKDRDNEEKMDINQPSMFFLNGNGFPKECYEPLLEAFYTSLKTRYNISLNYILSIDAVNQGQSAVINEKALGNDVHWTDSWRDVVCIHSYLNNAGHPIIDTPLIGVGHSFGGNVVFGASSINRRMFTTVLGIDPVLGDYAVLELDNPFAALSYRRRDLWPTRAEATKSLRSNGFYKRWDQRAFDKYIEYGIRDLPTLLYPEYPDSPNAPKYKPVPGEPAVTLTCPARNEVTTFVNLPEELSADSKFFMTDTLDCVHAIKKTKIPTRFILSSVSKSRYPVFAANFFHNENITYTWADDKYNHSIPFEHPEDCAEMMTDYLGPQIIKAIAQIKAEDEQLRYPGFHPVQIEKCEQLLKEMKELYEAKKRKAMEKQGKKAKSNL